ncbi:carboxypeptidase regulatory-like domain-containing protein [Arenimonas sp. MALMAid1274]|uniref:carboxypeptidase regulatory-like domain-containing protein n=1 Tax=Arenimonas sp. MALMAid1274 TaxID=3411630 RepID=UPI003BA13317
MNLVIAGVLAGVVLVASLRLWQQSRRGPWRAWRLAALLLGQAGAALLLYFALLPPAVPGQQGMLVVLTEGAVAPTPAAGETVVALPEAGEPANIERVPDLGTALRRYPGARGVRILGSGLVPRDRDAAAGVALEFEPAPLPTGIVALDASTQVPRGRRFVVQGRVHGENGSTLDLLDPAGRRIDRTTSDASGGFSLAAFAGPAGRVDYRLQRRDAQGAVVEDITLPMQVHDGAALRVALLSGGASPELKYLRRWALDAGLRLHSQISLGGGVEIGDPPLAMNAGTLREFDLVVLDERAWRSLGSGGRAALDEATQAGLGVLLRISGELTAEERARLREAGFVLEASEGPRSVRLAGTANADIAPVSGGADSAEARATDTAPLLTRRPLRLSAPEGAPLLRSADGEVLAMWRARGRGRTAVWLLSDSFRLALSGRSAAYGETWGQAFQTLARAQGATAPQLPVDSREGERMRLCTLPADATLTAPDGQIVPMVRDAAGCAAVWPTQPGWHVLRSADNAWAFPVRDGEAVPALRAAERTRATEALASTAAATASDAPPVEGRRWPWALAWLLLSAALWWLERSRAGR